MTHRICPLLLLPLLAVSNTLLQPKSPKEEYLEKQLPANFLQLVRENKINRQLYPPFADRTAWEALQKHAEKGEICRKLLTEADHIRQTRPVSITYTEFCRFARDGNRAEYEVKNYERRANLAKLALAMCISGDKNKYMPALLDYLYAILCEERWCFPAHCVWKNGILQERCQADLFANETCAQLGLLVTILGPELEAAAPGVLKQLRQKVYASSFDKLLSPETSSLNDWYHRGSTNWTTWCGYNMLQTAVCLEEDPAKLADEIQMMLYPLSRFIVNYAENGYCLEGPSYFPYSAGMIYRLVELFEKLVPGSMDAFMAVPKHRAMFEFIAGSSIGNGFVFYSDASGRDKPPYYLTNSIAARLHSVAAANIFRSQKNTEPMGGMGRELSENLNLLFDFPTELPAPTEKQKPFYHYKNQLTVIHAEAFSVSLMAGNNDAPHNHNDLGNFCLYQGSRPVVIDVGTGRYAAINFSPKRYTLWYTRGNGHNGPVINGVEQVAGRQYVATMSQPTRNGDAWVATCDLSKAYPEAAGVVKAMRSIAVTDTTVTVQDELQAKDKTEADVNLMVLGKPERRDDGIAFGNVMMRLNGMTVASVELQEESFNEWPGPLYRIVLHATSGQYQMIFTCE